MRKARSGDPWVNALAPRGPLWASCCAHLAVGIRSPSDGVAIKLLSKSDHITARALPALRRGHRRRQHVPASLTAAGRDRGYRVGASEPAEEGTAAAMAMANELGRQTQQDKQVHDGKERGNFTGAKRGWWAGCGLKGMCSPCCGGTMFASRCIRCMLSISIPPALPLASTGNRIVGVATPFALHSSHL